MALLNWIVIIILIFLVLFFLRMKHLKHKAFVIVMILLILFFYVSASNVFSQRNLDFKSFEGIVSAGKIYFSWLFHVVGNVFSITGKAVGDAKDVNWTGNLTKNLNGK